MMSAQAVRWWIPISLLDHSTRFPSPREASLLFYNINRRALLASKQRYSQPSIPLLNGGTMGAWGQRTDAPSIQQSLPRVSTHNRVAAQKWCFSVNSEMVQNGTMGLVRESQKREKETHPMVSQAQSELLSGEFCLRIKDLTSFQLRITSTSFFCFLLSSGLPLTMSADRGSLPTFSVPALFCNLVMLYLISFPYWGVSSHSVYLWHRRCSRPGSAWSSLMEKLGHGQASQSPDYQKAFQTQVILKPLWTLWS